MAQLAVPVVHAAYFGDPGGETEHFYWVQAMYNWGYSPLSAPALVVTPAALSRNNIVSLKWTPMPGAISYDVLRTLSADMPTGVAEALKLQEMRDKRAQEKRDAEEKDREKSLKDQKITPEEKKRHEEELKEEKKLRDESVPKGKDGQVLPEIACVVGISATNYTDYGTPLFPYDANAAGPHDVPPPVEAAVPPTPSHPVAPTHPVAPGTPTHPVVPSPTPPKPSPVLK